MEDATAHKWRVLSRLLFYLRQHRSRLALGFACTILTNAFLLAPAWVLKYAVDSLAQSITREKLIYYAALIVGLTVLQGIFRFGMRWLLIGLSRQIEYIMRNDLFRHMETLPVSF